MTSSYRQGTRLCQTTRFSRHRHINPFTNFHYVQYIVFVKYFFFLLLHSAFNKDLNYSRLMFINPLVPNDVYVSRTAQLISRRCILNIYSTNTVTEYSKHAAHSPFFFLSSRCRLFHNATFFGYCNIHILNTECSKILKKIPAPKC